MGKRNPKAPDHGRNARRRVRHRHRRYLIVCGGEVTEREYFQHIGQHGEVRFTVVSKTLDPESLARHAAKLKYEDSRNAENGVDPYAGVWVVTDVDEYRNHAQAQRICKKNGMELIISNPYFEVWLIDHVRVCPDSYTQTSSVERYAADLGVTTGHRHKYIDFQKIDGHMADAIANAGKHNTGARAKNRERLVPGQEQTYAPWTDMALIALHQPE
ncbi:RloB family protein [Bifidobacterium pullorum]|uniref:RloB family protein n=1 Tax=Bifidobacterium pullorum TaxID=78448 RepID=UPI003F245920